MSFPDEEQLAKKNKDGINISLPKDCIKSVILGERTSDHDKEIIVKAIKDSGAGIKLKKVVRKQGEYLLTIVDESFD